MGRLDLKSMMVGELGLNRTSKTQFSIFIRNDNKVVLILFSTESNYLIDDMPGIGTHLTYDPTKMCFMGNWLAS